MTRDEINKLLDTLTQEQRDGIARMIRETDPEGNYRTHPEHDYSFWCESVSDTLECLSGLFSSYDPESVLE